MSTLSLLLLFTQVHAFWQWVNLACGAALANGKRPLLVNLDETSISRAIVGGKGHVVTSKAFGHDADQQEAFYRIPASQRRGAVTHVALISAVPEMQRHLPQIFLAARARFSEQLANSVSAMESNCQFWREASGWNSSERMLRILDELATAVGGVRADWQIILVLDMASCHLTDEVAHKAAALGVWLVFVPTHLTWLVQPLDVSVFGTYKTRLCQAYHQLQARSPGGLVSDQGWAFTLAQTTLAYIERRDWSRAFHRVGVDGCQSHLADSLLRAMQPCSPEEVRNVARAPPNVEALLSLFPRRRRHPLVEYLRPVVASLLAAQNA